MRQKYLENAIICDFILCILIGIGLFFCRCFIKDYINVPSKEVLDKAGESLITVCATLIGFLLTIITIIVTFKKGFEDKEESNETKKEISNPEENQYKTIFNKKISKEKQFYGTHLHK